MIYLQNIRNYIKQRVKKFFKEAIEVKESELQKEKEEFQKEKSKKIKKRRRIKKQ